MSIIAEFMSIFIDLVLIFILALCIWQGYKKGLVMAVGGLLVLIIAVVGARSIAVDYSDNFSAAIKPFAVGMIDGAFSKTAENKKADSEEIYEFSVENLKKAGIFATAAEIMAGSLKNEVNTIGNNLKTAMVSKICSAVAYVIVFIVTFVMIIIIGLILVNLLDMVFRLPILDILNCGGGAALGLLKGLIVLFVIAWAARYSSGIIPVEEINKTVLLGWLMEHNMFTAILGL